MTGRHGITRRTVLRGTCAAIGLPLLEAMLPRARSAEAKPPVRLAFVYVPNGVHMPDWTPGGARPEALSCRPSSGRCSRSRTTC